MKRLFLLLAASLTVFASCEKGDDLKPNPSGTQTSDIAANDSFSIEDGGVLIASVTWLEPNNIKVGNFVTNGENKLSICDLGEVKGLGAIKSIPTSGFTTPALSNSSKTCEVRHGYIVKIEYDNGKVMHVRMYVDKTLVEKGNESKIVGAKIKYQYPFIP